MFPDGNLCTTEANAEFLAKNNLTHNPVAMNPIKPTQPDGRKLIRTFNATVQFSPHYVMATQDLLLLDPRGHCLAAAMRDRYARKLKTQPLWIVIVVAAGAKACVRIALSRRVQSSVYAALEARGYDRYGNGQGRNLKGTNLKGTMAVILREPLRAVSLPKNDFVALGQMAVAEIEAICQRGRGAFSAKFAQRAGPPRARSGTKVGANSHRPYGPKR